MFTKIKNTLIATTLLATVLSGSSSVSLYMSTLSMDYSEYADGRLLDTEESGFSDIYGFEVGFDHAKKINSKLSFGFEISYEYLYGETDYTGAYLGSSAGYGSLTSTTTNTVTDIYADIYMLYALHRSLDMKLSVGYGKHEWERELSSIQVETYRWYPLGVELATIFHIGRAFPMELELALGYKEGLSPEMDVSYPSAVLHLGGASCVEFKIGGKYAINNRFSVGFRYERLDQTIDRSDIAYTSIGAIYEPDSDDTQQRIKLGLEYSF